MRGTIGIVGLAAVGDQYGIDQCAMRTVGQRRWYRYHHLLADLLRQQLRPSGPDATVELHRRASLWHEQHGYADEAIRHALSARDWSRAASLMDEAAQVTWRNGEIGKLLSWVKTLPKTERFTHPRLCVYYGWVAALTGQYEESEEVLAQAALGNLHLVSLGIILGLYEYLVRGNNTLRILFGMKPMAKSRPYLVHVGRNR